MQLLMKTLAVAVLCVCSVLAQLPTESADLKLGKLFGVTSPNIVSDKLVYDKSIKPHAFGATGTINVDGFGLQELNTTSSIITPKIHGPEKEVSMWFLFPGQHVTRVICGFDGGGMIYLRFDSNTDADISHAGTAPRNPTDDMIDGAPTGKELSGFVTFADDKKNIVGVKSILELEKNRWSSWGSAIAISHASDIYITCQSHLLCSMSRCVLSTHSRHDVASIMAFCDVLAPIVSTTSGNKQQTYRITGTSTNDFNRRRFFRCTAFDEY